MATRDSGTLAGRRGTWTSRPARVALLAGVGIAGVQVFDPVHTHVPLCPFHVVTGLWCPLCGGLRSAYALTRLDLADALRDNALLVAAVPFLVWYWVDWLRRDRAGLPERRVPRPAVAALWLVALVFGILRNVPMLTAWLAPT